MIESIKNTIDYNLHMMQDNFIAFINAYAIISIEALIILILGFVASLLIYKFIIYLFVRFKILELIDRLDVKFNTENNKKDWENENTKLYDLVSKKIQIDKVVAKASSYYVFLLFFRWSLVILNITEIEQFLDTILIYLPKLFIWIVIWYFGLRFANFIYDVIYHSLNLTKQKTSRIIASWAKIVILFFTLMFVLKYTQLVDEFIINTVLVWFISMLTLAWWLAFWLWWRDIAREILESFRK